MHFQKSHSKLSVLDAVDNLSHMAELDLLTSENAAQKVWRNPQNRALNQERIKETFAILLKYLKELYEKDKRTFKEETIQEAVVALMLLTAEAIQKVDSHSPIFKGSGQEQSITELKEYKELQQFYLTKIAGRLHAPLELGEPWQEEWGKGESAREKGSPLQDLTAVYVDQEYELFQLRKEDGTPFYNRVLLRHMQWMGQFDVLFADPTMDDPLLRAQMISDRDAHRSAKEILKLAEPHIDAFFKEALKLKNISFVSNLSHCVMALMLASNQRNLMQNAMGKCALNYYHDFHFYLRKALLSEKNISTMVPLMHVLCSALFLSSRSRKDMIALIYALIDRGGQGSNIEKQTASPLSLWNNLQDDDAVMRAHFKQTPSGPLMKGLEVIQKGELLRGFDPLKHVENLGQLYTIVGKNLHITILRLPCPTMQQTLQKAEIAPEFLGFLHSLHNQRHLIFNLQDRTSHLEHARCKALEQIANRKEFEKTLMVVTLPKDTEFYLQSGEYRDLEDAKEFLKLLCKQIQDAEGCGFYFPKEIDQKQLIKFTNESTKTIHSVFFGGKKRLEHKNRLDFIEIFYLFLELKILEQFSPDSLSFTCKDGVDAGAAASAELYAFLRMMNDSSPWTKGEKDTFMWLMYGSALVLRQRSIDLQHFERIVSALSIVQAEIEAHFTATRSSCGKLLKINFFKDISVSAA